MTIVKRFGKPLAVVLGAGLLVFVGAMFGPRTAHALVATLVQVVNTPTNAIPAVQAPAASELYVYPCFAQNTGSSFAQCTFPPVPAGKTLIVEAVSIQSGSGPGADPASAFLYIPGGATLLYIPLSKQANQPNGLDSYTGAIGARVSLLSAPSCGVQLSASTSSGGIECTISGYLVPAI